MKKKIIKYWIFALSIGLFLPRAWGQNDFEVAKNTDIFVSILRELNSKYADEINVTDLTKTAIDAMLVSLDPYTVYYPESQIEDYRIMTLGQYGGIGSIIQQIGKEVVIAEPYENSPAAKAGLFPGDIIRKIDNQSVEGKNSEEVTTLLKGQPGTTLTIEVEHPYRGKRVLHITREEIKLPNIPYYGMLDSKIGYIKLEQFTENAGNEVKNAFQKLKEQGMDALVLDLRDNGGGLLQEAVNIMNIFVEQNTLIASTKGKIKAQNNTFKTRVPVLDKNIPVVVLVNSHSASASEIVSGSFQDLDRGVVVGKKTFGKGLVQNVVPISYNTSLKLTVSKYYIPSGRCVQHIDYFGKDSLHAKEIPDSLAVAYKTRKGRTVYDKGGVSPDVVTPDTMPSRLLISLIMNNLIFDFANRYHAQHPTLSVVPNKFAIDEPLYKEFVEYMNSKSYEYETDTELLLDDLKNAAEDEHYFETIKPLYEQIKTKIAEEKKQELKKYKQEISTFLASEIVERYAFQKGRIINLLPSDPDIVVAKSILHDLSRYHAILSPKTKKN